MRKKEVFINNFIIINIHWINSFYCQSAITAKYLPDP